METKDFFRGVSLFENLTESQLEKFAEFAVEVSFPAGSIIREADASDGMFVIKSGMAKVTKSGTATGGAEVELAMLHQGNVFGELSVTRSDNVTALEPVECYFLPQDAFWKVITDNPEIAVAIIQY